MRKMYRILMLPVLFAGLLTGCGDHKDTFTPTAELVGLGLATEVIKAKIERRLEVTCNPLNLLSDGSYCVSNYKPTDRQEVFCFKTLGGVDCYAEPDPYSLEGRQLPAAPRALADPRMPMTPPGRRAPPQVATAPIGMEPAAVHDEQPDERPTAGASEIRQPKPM
jgi:hypothetical protein